MKEPLLCVAKKIHGLESSPEAGLIQKLVAQSDAMANCRPFLQSLPVCAPRPALPTAEDRTATSERVPDPANVELVWESEWEKSTLETALARVCRRVSPKHAQILIF